MPVRNTMAGPDERSYEIDPAGQFRRDRHDPDLRASRRHHRHDVDTRELALVPRTGQPQARGRLRTAEVRVDEVALEMRGEYARAMLDACHAGAAHLIAQLTEL